MVLDQLVELEQRDVVFEELVARATSDAYLQSTVAYYAARIADQAVDDDEQEDWYTRALRALEEAKRLGFENWADLAAKMEEFDVVEREGFEGFWQSVIIGPVH
jgi:hypothetical protein